MKLGRHSRSKWEQGTPSARSQERAEAAKDDPAKAKTPARKNPDLCKAAHWKGPHAPELRLHEQRYRLKSDRGSCYWWVDNWREGKSGWRCCHEVACSGCGKILRMQVSPRECPLYREITEEETAGIRAEIEAWKIRVASLRYRRKPPITGPQGYRKPRE